MDTTIGLTWDQMTAAQRAASSLKEGKLVWTGSNVNTAAPGVLVGGTPGLFVTSPASVAGAYLVGLSASDPRWPLRG